MLQMNADQHTRRPAMTLLEIMVAVAVTSLVAGVAISLLVGLRDWDSNLRRQSIHNEQMLRLSEALRSDIRQAVDVTLPSSDALVIRAENERLTRYELSPDGCRRIVTTPSEAKPVIDAFNVGPSTSWSLAQGAPGRHTLFAVTFHRSSPNNEERHDPLIVHAAAGADAAPAAE
jgi:prepilin-type N-terminal cleavage/methylation domain-containing protein